LKQSVDPLNEIQRSSNKNSDLKNL